MKTPVHTHYPQYTPAPSAITHEQVALDGLLFLVVGSTHARTGHSTHGPLSSQPHSGPKPFSPLRHSPCGTREGSNAAQSGDVRRSDQFVGVMGEDRPGGTGWRGDPRGGPTRLL